MFKRVLLIILFISFFNTLQNSYSNELKIEFSGYYDDTLTVFHNNSEEKDFFLNQTRERINVSGKYEKKGDFSIAFIGTQYAGKTTYNLCDYLPRKEVDRLNLPVKIEYKSDIWLQEAYGSLYFDNLTFRIGRQKYYTGTGYAWNPTDILNKKNLLDPTYEIEGLDSVYLSYLFGEDTAFSGFYSYGTSKNNEDKENETLEEGDYQIRFKTNILGWDIAFHYTNAFRTFYDYEGLFDGSLDHSETCINIRWQLIAFETSGEIKGVGIHIESGVCIS